MHTVNGMGLKMGLLLMELLVPVLQSDRMITA